MAAALRIVLPPPPEHFIPTIFDAAQTSPPGIDLIRDGTNPSQGYTYVVGRPAIRIGRTDRGEDWGEVRKAFMARVDPATGTFRQSTENAREFVAIKKLKIAAVHRYLNEHSNRTHNETVHDYLNIHGCENPYKEMSRMQQFGDNIHILRPIEFLKDETYLYIITPWGRPLADELDWLNHAEPMDPNRCKAIARKLLRILRYLKQHRINHRDLKPHNLLLLPSQSIDGTQKTFYPPETLVAFDFAMSIHIPIDPNTGDDALIQHHGNYGTAPYEDPVVCRSIGAGYDGAQSDLWAAAVTVYNCLTNLPLYEFPLPYPHDRMYHYFVRVRGLQPPPLHPRTIHFLQWLQSETAAHATHRPWLVRISARHLIHGNVNVDAIRLLSSILRESLNDRITLEEAMNSAYVL